MLPQGMSRINSDNNVNYNRTSTNPGGNRSPVVSPTNASSCGIMLTTTDAYTLTDGPTIFIAEDIHKIADFYMKHTKIPDGMLQKILQKIIDNDKILEKISELEREIESQIKVKENSAEDTKAGGGGGGGGSTGGGMREKEHWDTKTENKMELLQDLRGQIRIVSLDTCYIPNTVPHQKIWAPNHEVHENAFVPNIEESTVKLIMDLEIDKMFKVLALLGIGVLIKHTNTKYEEIIKKMANEQKLFLILASSDYIYGTNYQFCHGFVGKDLTNMTPQKTLQAMGRIGRNNVQQEYTVRFRDDNMIRLLFSKPEFNLEAVNMSKLFSSDD
jgi:hypothetical protein